MKSSNAPVRIALLGAAGRMGRAVLESAHDYPSLRISAGVVHMGHRPDPAVAEDIIFTDDLHEALAISDVLLDFSAPPATAAALDACVTAAKPLVTGVTGLDASFRRKLAEAGHSIAVLAAPNMSLGANLLLELTRKAAAVLDSNFDIEITDIHHRGKQDAPSGTALALGEAAAAARGTRLEEQAVYTRQGRSAERRPGSIGFTSLRAADIAGDHSVLFAGPAERLELTHRAANRAAFARGALAAALWIARKPAGVYTMAEVLGLDGAAR